ncbi:MAG TPA: TylF/MycF/NovP-related O-methyltransferase, partial [Acidimicrobiales bacterium]|nr:TylF/MycF/NovP-related O-methyltransferase [Acidimicrobiales bacterium]
MAPLHFSREDAWDYENGFYLTSDVSRLGKAIAQYELYKRIVGLPGSVLEFGVYKGASLARLLTFRAILEAAGSRAVTAFDNFGEFPRSGDRDDLKFIEDFEGVVGAGFGVEEVREYLSAKGFDNFELVPGDVFDTLPNYVADHPQLRIALLHVDVDVYEPTRLVLDCVGDRVVPGGLVVIDDYGAVAGATRAVD